MKELRLIKVSDGFRVPYETDLERIKPIANGTLVFASIKQPRNYGYLQRYFDMLKYAFNFWEPEKVEKGLQPDKNFDTFRDDLQIAAGYFVRRVHVDGSITLKSKSISFAEMDEETFRKLYKSVFNVAWDLILSKVPGMTETEAHNAVNSMLSYE